MTPNNADPESGIDSEQHGRDIERLEALVAQAWSETSLTQTQFGRHLTELAFGYAEAPELEAGWG